MRSCPKCGSPRIHRSRSRGFFEKLRKEFTIKRAHRCQACGWRGWGPVTATPGRSLDHADRNPEPPDLEAIDAEIARSAHTRHPLADEPSERDRS